MQFNNIIEHHNVSVERGPMETLSLLSRAIGQSHFGHFSLCIFILLTTRSLLTVYSSSDDVEDDDDNFSLCIIFIFLTTHSLLTVHSSVDYDNWEFNPYFYLFEEKT